MGKTSQKKRDEKQDAWMDGLIMKVPPPIKEKKETRYSPPKCSVPISDKCSNVEANP